MSPDKKKRLLLDDEPEMCVGTCFSCIPQCERIKPDAVNPQAAPLSRDKNQKPPKPGKRNAGTDPSEA